MGVMLLLMSREAPGQPTASIAEDAVVRSTIDGLLANFWVGDDATGYFVQDKSVDTPGFWDRAQLYNVIYSWWKLTGNPSARTRLAAGWAWIKRTFEATDLTTCGRGSKANFALDDTAWDTGFLLQAYEATGDGDALVAAKGALDCAWARWGASSPAEGATREPPLLDGGLWYSDDRTEKSLYESVLLLDALHYSALTGDSHYRDRVTKSEAWFAATMQHRSGVFYEGIDPRGNLLGGANPPRPKQAGSWTMLAGNMAMAVLDARLYELTNDSAYLSRMSATARGIQALETDAKGCLLNDRDAFVNGWAIVLYVREAVPMLPDALKAEVVATIRATSAVVRQQASQTNGMISADWGGPENVPSWSSVGSTPDRGNVSAGGAMVMLAGATLRTMRGPG